MVNHLAVAPPAAQHQPLLALCCAQLCCFARSLFLAASLGPFGSAAGLRRCAAAAAAAAVKPWGEAAAGGARGAAEQLTGEAHGERWGWHGMAGPVGSGLGMVSWVVKMVEDETS